MSRSADIVVTGVVLSIGSINLDIQVRGPSWPKQSQTMVAGDCLCASGGKAANVAVIASRLGARAVLFGRVGDDPFGERVLTELRREGLDTTHVGKTPRTATGVAMIVVREDGDKTIVLASNANDRWEPGAEQSLTAAIAAAKPHSVLVVDFEVPERVVCESLKATIAVTRYGSRRAYPRRKELERWLSEHRV